MNVTEQNLISLSTAFGRTVALADGQNWKFTDSHIELHDAFKRLDRFRKTAIKFIETTEGKIFRPFAKVQARKAINKIGKLGKRNIRINKILRAETKRLDIRSCELNLKGCTGTLFPTNAHSTRRRHWAVKGGELESVRACVNCHRRADRKRVQNKRIIRKARKARESAFYEPA